MSQSQAKSTEKVPLIYLFEEIAQDCGGVLPYLKQFGFETQSFAEPRQLLRALQQKKPDVCVLGMSSRNITTLLALTKSIRKVMGSRPILMAVVKSKDQEHLHKLLEAGVDTRLKSPVKPADLARKMAEYVQSLGLQKALKELDQSPVGDLQLPEIVDWYFQNLSKTFATISTVLENFDDIEMQVKFYTEKIAPYRDEFMDMINTKRGGPEKADLSQCLRLYGIANVRKLIVSLKLSDALKTNLIQFNAKSKLLSQEPSKVLSFASRTVDFFGEESSYRQIAFNSGLILDILHHLAEQKADRKVAIRKQLDANYQLAFKKAQTGLKKGKSLKDLALGKHAITAFLLNEAGKAVMSIFYSDYADFRTRFEKKSIKPYIQQIAEREKYGISANILASVICQSLPGLEEASQALLFLDSPFLIKSSTEDHHAYTLGALCSEIS